MIRHQQDSIKSRIRNLILLTIFLLILSGCAIAIFMFSKIMRMEKSEYLESVLADLHAEAVLDVREVTRSTAAMLSSNISAHPTMLEHPTELQAHLRKTHPETDFLIYSPDYKLLFGSSEDIFSVSADSELLKEREDFFLGSESLGIDFYAKSPIVDTKNNLIGYAVTWTNVSKQEFVDRVQKLFHVDATIFYKDLRVATTVTQKNTPITGSRLDSRLAKDLLAGENMYVGNASILGVPYLTAYKSFGNPNAAPIGILFVGESLSQYNRTMAVVIAAVVFLGLTLFLVALKISNRWLNRNIVEPMMETTEMMVQIAEGHIDYSQSMDKKHHYYEFSRLLSALYRMLDNLEQSQSSVERIAYYDEMTALPNRFYMFRRENIGDRFMFSPELLILLDIDDLNTVNDIYSRSTGDALILAVSRFLTDNFPETNGFRVFRLNGGSFVLLNRLPLPMDKLLRLVDILTQRFKAPFACDAVMLEATASIGIAQRRHAGESIEDLLHHAELAMYEVKRAAKNSFLFYDPEMSNRIREQRELEVDLKNALDNDEFFLVYQPKFNLVTGMCDSFEALLRWNSPKRGLVPPIEFISLAESSGLIVPIGQWVMQEACHTVKTLSHEYGYPFRMAVNISPVQINREDFFKMIMTNLIAYELEPHQLELEITENLLMTSFSSAVKKLNQLSILGLKISVDDFGKGYSSLAYLQALPIHTLKIDKMFVDAIDEDAETMIGDIIRLGHHMNLKIVAEGVETALQANYLKAGGCDSIQGYYYSRPLPLDQLKVFLDNLRATQNKDYEEIQP